MRNHTPIGARVALFVWALFVPVLCALAALGRPAPAPGQEAGPPLRFAFGDIVRQAEQASPLLRVLDGELATGRAAMAADLAISSPTLGYEHESVGDETEWQISLAKRFERPLGRGRETASWRLRLDAAGRLDAQQRRDLLAGWRAGYVEIRLLDDHIERLEALSAAVDRIVAAAGSRHDAGSLSGLENRLIRSAAYALDVQLGQTHRERNRRAGAWGAALGLPVDRRLELTTPIRFLPVALGEEAPDAPAPLAVAALEAEAEALEHRAAARSTLLPAFEVSGGFKRVAGRENGLVAGVALDLPLTGSERREADELRAERRRVQAESESVRARLAAEIRFLRETIDSTGARLASAPPSNDTERFLETLAVSYDEGSLTLDELLGAVAIEADALAAHREDLTGYYRHLFELEALTGAQLVRLDSGEHELGKDDHE